MPRAYHASHPSSPICTDMGRSRQPRRTEPEPAFGHRAAGAHRAANAERLPAPRKVGPPMDSRPRPFAGPQTLPRRADAPGGRRAAGSTGRVWGPWPRGATFRGPCWSGGFHNGCVSGSRGRSFVVLHPAPGVRADELGGSLVGTWLDVGGSPPATFLLGGLHGGHRPLQDQVRRRDRARLRGVAGPRRRPGGTGGGRPDGRCRCRGVTSRPVPRAESLHVRAVRGFTQSASLVPACDARGTVVLPFAVCR